jgi:hypothetical protein
VSGQTFGLRCFHVEMMLLIHASHDPQVAGIDFDFQFYLAHLRREGQNLSVC